MHVTWDAVAWTTFGVLLMAVPVLSFAVWVCRRVRRRWVAVRAWWIAARAVRGVVAELEVLLEECGAVVDDLMDLADEVQREVDQ